MALIDEIRALEQQRAQQEANRNTGTLADVTDLAQSGAYGAVSGMAEFVGAEKVADYFKGKQEEQFETLTPEMTQAMGQRFINDDLSLGEGLTNWRAWTGQAAVLAGQMVPSLIPGGAAARGAAAIGAGARAASAAGMATNAAANAAIAGGMQGQAVEDDVLNTSYDDLKDSPLFRQKVAEFANDPDMTSTEKLERARQFVATQASERVMSDPTLIGINALGGMLGDKAMTKIISGNLGKTIKGNIAKGMVSEGGTESIQGGFGQYVSNVAQNDVGLQTDLMDGVYAAALEEGLIAGGLGGGAGAVGGAQNRIANLDRVVKARQQIEGIIKQPTEELLSTGFDREKAKQTIQEMAENAAIKMGFDANEAADIAAQSVNAAVGDAPSIDEQVANVETKTNDYMNRTPEERQALVANLLQGVIDRETIGDDPQQRRTPADLAYQMGGRTGRMMQAAQTARADNVAMDPTIEPTAEPSPETMAEPTAQPTGQAMIDQMAQESADAAATRPEPTRPTTEPTETKPQITIENIDEGIRKAREISPVATDRLGELFMAGEIDQATTLSRLNDIVQSAEPAQQKPVDPEFDKKLAERLKGDGQRQPRETITVEELEKRQLAAAQRAESAPSRQETITPEELEKRQLSAAQRAEKQEKPRESITVEELEKRQLSAAQRQPTQEPQLRQETKPVRERRERELAAAKEQREQQEMAEAEQAAEAASRARTGQVDYDVVAQKRQPREQQRFEEMTPQQQIDYAQGKGKTFGTLDKKPDQPSAKDSPRIAKKKGARLNRKLNAIYERISKQNPTEMVESETFGYRPNSAMADAFAKLQTTTQEPTPEQFNERVDQLVEDQVITKPEAQTLKKSIREVAFNVTGRTERMKQAVAKKRQERAAKPEPQPEPQPEDDYDVEEDLGPDFEEDYGMAEPEPALFEGATYDPQPRLGDTEWQESGGWEPEGSTIYPDSWKGKEQGKEYVVTKERDGRTYSIWSRDKDKPADQPAPPVQDNAGPTGEYINDNTVPVYGKHTPVEMLWDQGYRSTNVYIDEGRHNHNPQMEYVAIEGGRNFKGKYEYWYRLKPKAKTMESGKEYDWDDDVVRFNETTGRVQTRSSEGGKWRNMKFNWMDKFTEDTGVTIPEEYREAHRQPRRDKQEEKPAQTGKMSDVAEDHFSFTQLVSKSLKDEGDKVEVGEDYKLSPEANKAYQDRLIKDLPRRPKAKHLQPAYDKLASAVIKGVDVTFTRSQYGYSQRFKVLDYTLSGDANQYGITASHLSVDGDTDSDLFPTTFNRMVQKEYQKSKAADTSADVNTKAYFDAVQDKQPSWNDGLTAKDYEPIADQEIVSENKSAPQYTEVSTKSFKGQKTYDKLRVATWARMNKFMPEALKLVEQNFDRIKTSKPPYSDINGLYNGKMDKKVGDATGRYVLREAMEQHYKDLSKELSIESEVKAKTDKIMVSAKKGELTRQFDRLTSGQIKPDQVVRGASGATHPRKAAFEWLYKEINNIDPDNKTIERVGLGSNGKPFKSEVGARNQGKGQKASEVVPASDIVAGEDGFVWVKYEDTTPDGTDTGKKPEATKGVASSKVEPTTTQQEATTDVSDTVGDLERDSGQDTVDQEISPAERRKQLRKRDREVDEAVEQGRTTGRREPSIPPTGPLDAGTSNTDTVDKPDGKPVTETGVTGGADPRGNDIPSGAGVPVVEAAAEAEISRQASERASELTRKELQAAADKAAVVFNDAKNIDKTLPLLSPEQRTDVVAAEKRLYGENQKGMMFTNGTGTGKTYTGCGVIKRVVQNGGKVLVVAPAGTIKGWQNAAKDLAFDMVKLKDKSTGAGDNQAVITSFQNFGDNQVLLEDKFDLVVYDESHKLMANMQGDSTKATAVHYAMTGTSDRGYLRFEKDLDAVKQDIKDHVKAEKEAGREISEADAYNIPKFAKRLTAVRNKIEKFSKKHARLEKKSPTKSLFLSATPFSGHKSVFYADGYLFDTDQGFKQGGYNSGSPQQQFLVKNFGYRMKYNKANQPGAEVDVGLLERDWADQMFESGAMVGRTLNLSQDYSRQFTQVEQGVGKLVDELYNVVNHKDYPKLSAELVKWRKGGMDRKVAEALRIRGAMGRIQGHLELGRKVVVFHQRMEMNITDPFAGPLDADGQKEYQKLRKAHPRLASLDFSDLTAAPKAIVDEFGSDRVGLFNGQVTKTRNADLKDFNKDGGKKDILVIQKDAGKEGLSAHDVTGQSQRALIVTNTPQSPADAIQMEGRIYRFGLKSNAVVEYPTVQTNFEKIAFRDVVSNRTATAENLAMGSQARMLRTSFRDGYMQPYMQAPNADQGVGGKEGDRTVGQATQLDRAKTYYYKRQQKTQATKAAEGTDYFATPEPVGLAMVNMAQILPGETALEPSAGHGAIAHWFPESATAVAIEQSPELIGDLAMFTDADVRNQDFEDLNIINKFDAVTMNPPFGSGGSLAIQHIDKATKHLNDGGRVVAIYPEGPAADKKFDKWYESVEGIYLTGEIKLPAVTFKRAGTGVRTRILILDKDTSGKSVSQSKLNIDYGNETDPNALFERINELEAPKRPDVQISERDVGMSFNDKDGKFLAELNSYSSKGRDIGIRETDKIAQKYFGEKQVSTDYFGDKDYAYEFDTNRDRQRFAKGVLEQWNRQFKREKATSGTTSFKDSDDIRFSKETSIEAPAPTNLFTGTMDLKRAQSVVNAIEKEYNQNNDIDINVFEDKTGRYDEATLQFLPDNHPADYHPRKVMPDGSIRKPQINIFVKPHRESAARSADVRVSDFDNQLRKSIRHELLGHYGLDTLGKSNKDALLSRINQTRGKALFKDVWAHVDRVYDGDSQSIKNEEFFARFAEKHGQEKDPLWLSILDTFTKALQRVGLLKGQLTRSEINDAISSIRKDIRSGKASVEPTGAQVMYRKQSPADVETIANDFIAQYQGLSNVNVMIVPNQAALSEITSVEPNAIVKGAYMPSSDTLLLVADNLNNAEDARRVLRHELLAHKGLMQSLSDSEVDSLTRKVMGLQNAKSLADIWKTVNNSYKTAPDAIKAEEVIARIAEEPRGVLGQVADQVISWVMGAMRRSGLLGRDKVTVAEIRNMLNNVEKDLRNNSGRLNSNDRKIRFSQEVSQDESIVKLLSENQAPNRPTEWIKRNLARSKVADAVKDKWRSLLTLRQLVDEGKKYFGETITGYIGTVNKMLSEQNQMMEETGKAVDKIRRWSTKNKPEADKLFNLMHDATLAGIDPTQEYQSLTEVLQKQLAANEERLLALSGTSGYADKRRAELIAQQKELIKEINREPIRKKEYGRIKKRYDALEALSPEAVNHFKDLRVHYDKQRRSLNEILVNRIEALGDKGGKATAMALADLRIQMERASLEGYFPLTRFGKYWINTVDPSDGQQVFTMYETEAEMREKTKLLDERSIAYTSGRKLEESPQVQAASLGFVNDVISGVKGAKRVNPEVKEELSDMVYQLYLQSMPERSIRKSFIHRKGVQGFSDDVVRAMADHGAKQARQQARLANLDDLNDRMEQMREMTKLARDVGASRTFDEMVKRHEWVKNPQRSKWAQSLTKAGFMYMIGPSPASALVNLTQSFQIGVPVIGSRHGELKTAGLIAKEMAIKAKNAPLAAQQWMRGERDREQSRYFEGLSDDEKIAYKEAQSVGAIDNTETADLMGLSEDPSAQYTGKWSQFQRTWGAPFQKAEQVNREVTFMVAYRLEKEKLKKEQPNLNSVQLRQAATKYAVDATWDSHFDYNSLNRSRFMQGDAAAVAFQFKQYSQAMTYYLATNFFKSVGWKSATPAERKVARRQLIWTLGITFGMGGLSALPLFYLKAVINMAHDAFGDDDEPWDFDTEMKSMLSDYFGEEISKGIYYGALPNISGRISFDSMWWREPYRDMPAGEYYADVTGQLLGPTIGGMGLNMVTGAGLLANGEYMQAAEKASPTAVRSLIKATRQYMEGGVTNSRGEVLVDDLSVFELMFQAAGLTPSRAVYRYDSNGSMKAYELATLQRRRELMTAYYMAWRTKDSEATKNIMAKIKAFNRSEWGRLNPIRSANIKASIKRRQRNLNRSDRGLLVSPKLERKINESSYWD